MKNRGKKIVWIMLIVSAITFCLFAAGAGAEEKVQYGGTLTFTDVAPMGNPMSWDAADWNWRHGYDTGYYIEHLLMGDLQKGPRGTKQFSFQQSGDYFPGGVVRGELMEKWEVQKKPLAVIFHLRKGVMWQEKPGVMKAREFVADDVVHSLNRLKSSRKATKEYMDFVDRFEVKDKYTVIMYMKEWNSEWAYSVAWGYYDGIQAPEAEKAPGGPSQWQNACGTGPFMLEDYKNGHSTTYKKNPNYWDSEVINKKKYKLPFVDKVISMHIADEGTRLTALRTGKLDIMTRLDCKVLADLKKTTPELILSKYLLPATAMITLRMDRKPFNDIRVRRALNMAIDKRQLIKAVYCGQGDLVSIPYPSSSKTIYTPLEQLPPAARELYVYNPEKAKKLLAEAGYPNGFSFKCSSGVAIQEYVDQVSMIVAYLEKIGVKMELDLMDYPSSLSKMTKKVHENGHLVLNSQGAPLPYIRKSFVTGQTWNASMMSDPYVDKTYRRLISDPNISQKQMDAELKKLGVYIIEQAPGILLSTPYHYVAWWPWVKNYYGEIRVGAHRIAPVIARIWIDQELKKKMGY
jgi:peptide/nickel transport system substrate-binding protein